MMFYFLLLGLVRELDVFVFFFNHIIQTQLTYVDSFTCCNRFTYLKKVYVMVSDVYVKIYIVGMLKANNAVDLGFFLGCKFLLCHQDKEWHLRGFKFLF